MSEYSSAFTSHYKNIFASEDGVKKFAVSNNPFPDFLMGILRQLVSFGGVGAIATTIQYLILVVLAEVFGTDPVVASTIGYISSALLNYTLNYRLTFVSDRPHIRAIQIFALVALAGSMLNAGIMHVLLHRFDVNYLVAQVFATGVVFLWNFFAHRRFTFGKS